MNNKSPNLHKKAKHWRILVVEVKWWHRANGLLGAITDVPGDIMCGSHHKSFFYTAEVVGMAVNNSPFLTRLTRAISFNVLLTKLLGSNKTNSKVTPLQTPISRSFIFYVNKKTIRYWKQLDNKQLDFSSIRLFILLMYYD